MGEVQLGLPGDKRSKLCLQVARMVLIYRKHNRSCETIVQEHLGEKNSGEWMPRRCHGNSDGEQKEVLIRTDA